MLTVVIVNERPNAEFLIVLPTKEIADLAFSQALGMVQNDRSLMQRFHAQQHLKRLRYRPSGATLQVMAFISPDVMTGVKPAAVLMDEQHVIAMRNDAGSVMRQIRGGKRISRFWRSCMNCCPRSTPTRWIGDYIGLEAK